MSRFSIPALFLLMASGCIDAEDFDRNLSEYTATIGQSRRVYRGPRVPRPVPVANRDDLSAPRCTATVSPHVLIRSQTLEPQDCGRIEAAVETARQTLSAWGWGELVSDGFAYSTPEVDLVFERIEEQAPQLAQTEVLWLGEPVDSDFDRQWVSSLTRLTHRALQLDSEIVVAATYSYTLTLLASQDPAELAQTRALLATYLTYQITGRWPSHDFERATTEQGWASHEGLQTVGPDFLNMLAHHHGEEGSGFLRDIWLASWQKTPDDGDYQADPDFLGMLRQSIAFREDSLTRELNLFSLNAHLRPPSGERFSDHPFVHAESSEPNVIAAALPTQYRAPVDILPTGSHSLRVNLPPDFHSPLQVWLRGEGGTRWSIQCVLLDQSGRSIRVITAPPRTEPRAYLPIETSSNVSQVMIVVTNLGPDVLDLETGGYELGNRFHLLLSHQAVASREDAETN